MKNNDNIRLTNYKLVDQKNLIDEAIIHSKPTMFFMNKHTHQFSPIQPGHLNEIVRNQENGYEIVLEMAKMTYDTPYNERKLGKSQRVKYEDLFISELEATEVLRSFKEKYKKDFSVMDEMDPRSRKTYLQVIGALLSIFDGATTKDGIVFDTQDSLKVHIKNEYHRPSERTLDDVFRDANQMLPVILPKKNPTKKE